LPIQGKDVVSTVKRPKKRYLETPDRFVLYEGGLSLNLFPLAGLFIIATVDNPDAVVFIPVVESRNIAAEDSAITPEP
jgi:hypothetical protein